MGGVLFTQLAFAPTPQVEIAGYATSLQGRTASQKHNAQLAAIALDGKIVAPGATFSFNNAVQSWSLDAGYRKAPVSFDGELVRAYGGGVCQTSTTLYNAVLLAGLPIIERHPHVFRPTYIAPGRDAAVAFPGVDLRFKNPHAWPIRMRAKADGDTLEIHLWGAKRSEQTVHIRTQVLAVSQPRRLTRALRSESTPWGRAYLRSPGVAGFRVVTYRVVERAGHQAQRERLSDDSYPAMNRVIAFRTSSG
jgi:vancomycin resistance protein YoaR